MRKRPFFKLNRAFDRVDKMLQRRINGIDLELPDAFDPTNKSIHDAQLESWQEIQKEYIGHFAIRSRPDFFQPYEEIFGAIDQKASSLLTHISLMLTVTTLLMTFFSSAISNIHQSWPLLLLDALSSILIFSYICVAFTLLRVIRFWSFGLHSAYRLKKGRLGNKSRDYDVVINESSLDEDTTEYYYDIAMGKEIHFRSRMYRISLNATSALTAFSAILLVLYLVMFLISRIGP